MTSIAIEYLITHTLAWDKLQLSLCLMEHNVSFSDISCQIKMFCRCLGGTNKHNANGIFFVGTVFYPMID